MNLMATEQIGFFDFSSRNNDIVPSQKDEPSIMILDGDPSP
jgi:hypothetical protein